MELLGEIFRPTQRDLQRAALGDSFRHDMSSILAVVIGVTNPTEWRVCSKCKGAGKGFPPSFSCMRCEAKGYEVSHAGDFEEPETA